MVSELRIGNLDFSKIPQIPKSPNPQILKYF
jgi:hypothetical protein